MKQGISSSMEVEFEDLTLDLVESIEFLFKKKLDKNAPAVKKNLYPQNVELDDGVFYIPWSRKDTYQFDADKDFYMDTRIKLKGSADSPETPIIKLKMNKTLFNNGEVIADD